MSPELVVPLAAGAASVLVAAITFIFGPTIKVWIERRAERESRGEEGWTEAVDA